MTPNSIFEGSVLGSVLGSEIYKPLFKRPYRMNLLKLWLPMFIFTEDIGQ